MKDFREFLEERMLNEAKDRITYDNSFNINANGATEGDTIALMRKNYNILLATKNMLTQMFNDAPTASKAKDAPNREDAGGANPIKILNKDMDDINTKFFKWFDDVFKPRKPEFDERMSAINRKAKTREELKAKQEKAEEIKNELRGIKAAPEKKEEPAPGPKTEPEEKVEESLEEAIRIPRPHLPADWHLHRNVKKKIREDLEGLSMSSSLDTVRDTFRKLETDYRKRGQKLIEIQGGQIEDALNKLDRKLRTSERAIRYIDNPRLYIAEVRNLTSNAYSKLVAMSSMLSNIINEYDDNVNYIIKKIDDDYNMTNRRISGINTDIALGKEERAITRKETAKEIAKNVGQGLSGFGKQTLDAVSSRVSQASDEIKAKIAEKKNIKAANKETEGKFRSEVSDIIDDRQTEYMNANVNDIRKIAARIIDDAEKTRKKERKEINPAEAIALFAFYDRMSKNGGELSDKDKKLIGSGDKFANNLTSAYFSKFKDSNPKNLLKKIVTTASKKELPKASELGVGDGKGEPVGTEKPETEKEPSSSKLTNTAVGAAKDFDNKESIFDYALSKAKELKNK